MKRLFVGLLAFMLVLSITGCGAKKKAGEALAEKILDKAGIDADLDGDKVVVKGEDGQEVTFGGTQWPTSALAKSIPECKSGKIYYVMESDESLFIALEDITDKDFSAYLEEIKLTYTEDPYELRSDSGMMFAAENSAGEIGVILNYDKETGLSITVSKVAPKEA